MLHKQSAGNCHPWKQHTFAAESPKKS